MSKKILVLGILFGLISLIVFRWSVGLQKASAQNITVSATYSEQQGYERFVEQLPQQIRNRMIWNLPFYMVNGGLPRVIRNCAAYITVNELLVQQQTPNKEPVVEEPKRALRKQIALTFDDGPNNKSTVQILNILQKYDVKATFFVLGQNVAKYPEIVKQAAEQGHEIANHSWSHKNLTKLNQEQMHAEIDQASEAIFAATGHYPTAYRPPYGAINDNVRKEIHLAPVLWNIDTMDWHHKNPAKTLATVRAHAKDRGIILMHDIHQESADALEAVIQYLQQEDYEFVTIETLYQ